LANAVWTPTHALVLFLVLQCLDLVTTLIFLNHGMAEGNPIVRWALSSAAAPWAGLMISKLMAAMIGQYCYRSRRTSLLRLANAGYSLVVGWNLIAIAPLLLAR
jgi:Domain of unknown function (DUF5658)